MTAESSSQVSDVINVREFLTQWSTVLNLSDLYKGDEDPQNDINKYGMDITDEVAEELQSVCCVEALGNDTCWEGHIGLKNVPENPKLLSVRFQKEELEKRKSSRSYKLDSYKRCKYKIDLKVEQGILNKTPEEGNAVEQPEVILTVKICRPYHHKRTNRIMDDQTFQVLGQQSLTELRDKIPCVHDFSVPGDFSESPDTPQDVLPKDLYKSGFFYIEGVFYNDMRDPSCRDYSDVITNWARDPARGIGPFESRKMEEHTFLDLNLRIGQPYVYQHQAGCEHIIIFSDLRVVHPDDCQDKTDYPLLVDKKSSRRVICRLCQVTTARWQVTNSVVSPEDPCFYCDSCFRMLHYNKYGEKVCNFQAYVFYDRNALM